MNTMSMTIGSSGVTLLVPEGARETVERREGHADVHRYFADSPVVVAAQVRMVHGEPVDLVAEASGQLVADYRRRAGYHRVSREAPDVPGATESTMLDFEWENDGGVLMHSIALVASDGQRLSVIHCALPKIHGDATAAEAERIAASCEFG